MTFVNLTKAFNMINLHDQGLNQPPLDSQSDSLPTDSAKQPGAKSKMQPDMLDELLYAADMAKSAKTEKIMQGYGSSFINL